MSTTGRRNMLQRKTIPTLPWLPVADEEPTPLLKATLQRGLFPPLMKNKSWTKSVPFKVSFQSGQGQRENFVNLFSQGK